MAKDMNFENYAYMQPVMLRCEEGEGEEYNNFSNISRGITSHYRRLFIYLWNNIRTYVYNKVLKVDL